MLPAILAGLRIAGSALSTGAAAGGRGAMFAARSSLRGIRNAPRSARVAAAAIRRRVPISLRRAVRAGQSSIRNLFRRRSQAQNNANQNQSPFTPQGQRLNQANYYAEPFQNLPGGGDPGQSQMRMQQFSTGLLRMANHLTLGATQVAGFVRQLHGFSSTLVDSQRGTARYSGVASLAMANLDTQRTFREIHRARETEKSTKLLTESLNKLEEAMHPWETGWQNAINTATSWLNETTANFVNWVNNGIRNATGMGGGEAMAAAASYGTQVADAAVGLATGSSGENLDMAMASLGAGAYALVNGQDVGEAMRNQLRDMHIATLPPESRFVGGSAETMRIANMTPAEREQYARERAAWRANQLEEDKAKLAEVERQQKEGNEERLKIERDRKRGENASILNDLFGLQLQKHQLKAATAPRPGIPDKSAKVQKEQQKERAQNNHVSVIRITQSHDK